jgi:N-acetylmuramoyl-L-alanine amidase
MKICLDAGHGWDNKKAGGYDPGAVAGGNAEADIALLWALSGRYILTKIHGIETWLTRDDDQDRAPLASRDERAKAAGCTHLISFHCNAVASPTATGTETFYRDASDQRWAKMVLNAAVPVLGLRNRGVKHESESQHPRLSVFDFVGRGTLLELGFITNRTDRARMLDRDVRVKFFERLVQLMNLGR